MPNVGHHSRPHDKGVPGLVIEHQVQIALSVASLLALQLQLRGNECAAMCSSNVQQCASKIKETTHLGQHVQARCQKLDFRWHNGQLALFGLGGHAHHAQNGSSMHGAGMGQVVCFRPVVLKIQHDLDARPVALQRIKLQLGTSTSKKHHPSSQRNRVRVDVRARRQIAVLLHKLWNGHGSLKLMRVTRIGIRECLHWGGREKSVCKKKHEQHTHTEHYHGAVRTKDTRVPG